MEGQGPGQGQGPSQGPDPGHGPEGPNAPDILTQMQNALDTLLAQFYAGLVYSQTRHPPALIPGQHHNAGADAAPGAPPGAASPHAPTGTGTNNNNGGSKDKAQDGGPADDGRPRSPAPDPDFLSTQHEIAEDIVMNMARIEALIARLPGIGESEREQLGRMEELNVLLREEEGRRVQAVREKERLLRVLDERIMRVRRP